MANYWDCQICKQGLKEPKVVVFKNKKVVYTTHSILKAENYSFKNLIPPVLIKFSYVCSRCKHESRIVEKVYNNI